MMYSVSYLEADTQFALRQHPLVFGAWHCYVHCVKRVWTVFRPWWSALENPALLGDDPSAVKCYDHPALIQLEHMVVALAIEGPAAGADVLKALKEVKAEPESRFKCQGKRLLTSWTLGTVGWAP